LKALTFASKEMPVEFCNLHDMTQGTGSFHLTKMVGQDGAKICKHGQKMAKRPQSETDKQFGILRSPGQVEWISMKSHEMLWYRPPNTSRNLLDESDELRSVKLLSLKLQSLTYPLLLLPCLALSPCFSSSALQ
jgi:hypothetical protein